MKTIAMVSLVALSLTLGSASAQDAKPAPKAEGADELKDLKAKTSYSVGYQVGKNLKAASIDVDPAIIARAVADAMAGSKSLLTEAEMEAAMRSAQVEAQRMAGEKGRKEGEAYLAKNKAKPGVTTTASGLQYEVLREGKGAKPKASDAVKVHYAGTLLDGTEFDSSYKRGEPISFPLSNVIPGWTEGVQLMKVGSKFRFTIPSNLAYGAKGSPPKIPPNSALIFDVELLGIE